MSKTYQIWAQMKQRCDNPNNVDYENYGGRGIGYATAWAKYSNFRNDMGLCPPGLSIDRIDNEAGYSKENCRWATAKEQRSNQRVRRRHRNNTSGLSGVNWSKRDSRWYAYGRFEDRAIHLYCGGNFFEACCARKSWETKQLRM